MNFRFPLMAIRTRLAKDERQSCTSLVGIVFGFADRPGGRVIGVLEGGVTGYEQYGWGNGRASDATRETLSGDVCPCAGTVGSWDRLVIPASEMQRFWAAYDAHVGGTQYHQGRAWVAAAMRCVGQNATRLVHDQVLDVLGRAQNSPPLGVADGSIPKEVFEALRGFNDAFQEMVVQARRYWTACAAPKSGGVDFARHLRENPEAAQARAQARQESYESAAPTEAEVRAQFLAKTGRRGRPIGLHAADCDTLADATGYDRDTDGKESYLPDSEGILVDAATRGRLFGMLDPHPDPTADFDVDGDADAYAALRGHRD